MVTVPINTLEWIRGSEGWDSYAEATVSCYNFKFWATEREDGWACLGWAVLGGLPRYDVDVEGCRSRLAAVREVSKQLLRKCK